MCLSPRFEGLVDVSNLSPQSDSPREFVVVPWTLLQVRTISRWYISFHADRSTCECTLPRRDTWRAQLFSIARRVLTELDNHKHILKIAALMQLLPAISSMTRCFQSTGLVRGKVKALVCRRTAANNGPAPLDLWLVQEEWWPEAEDESWLLEPVGMGTMCHVPGDCGQSARDCPYFGLPRPSGQRRLRRRQGFCAAQLKGGGMGGKGQGDGKNGLSGQSYSSGEHGPSRCRPMMRKRKSSNPNLRTFESMPTHFASGRTQCASSTWSLPFQFPC